MSSPIFQLFIGRNNIAATLARKNMPEAEQKTLDEKHQESLKANEVGVVLICNSAWADESRPWWGVLRFPSLEARIKHTATLQEIGWMDATDAFTLLGTSQNEPAEVKFENPIYKLWLIKNNPAAAQMEGRPKGLEALMWARHNALYEEYKSQVMLYCNTNWCDETYSGFGISVYPNIEANMRIMEGLNELGWPRYLECNTLLGTHT